MKKLIETTKKFKESKVIDFPDDEKRKKRREEAERAQVIRDISSLVGNDAYHIVANKVLDYMVKRTDIFYKQDIERTIISTLEFMIQMAEKKKNSRD